MTNLLQRKKWQKIIQPGWFTGKVSELVRGMGDPAVFLRAGEFLTPWRGQNLLFWGHKPCYTGSKPFHCSTVQWSVPQGRPVDVRKLRGIWPRKDSQTSTISQKIANGKPRFSLGLRSMYWLFRNNLTFFHFLMSDIDFEIWRYFICSELLGHGWKSPISNGDPQDWRIPRISTPEIRASRLHSARREMLTFFVDFFGDQVGSKCGNHQKWEILSLKNAQKNTRQFNDLNRFQWEISHQH